jgi:adenine/guanine phosphoribosyltransferase-like PRPP-binding protein
VVGARAHYRRLCGPRLPRQRSREGKDRPVIEGKWRVDPERVHDQDLLVLDDLMTSGGTLFSFAAALRQAGANRVTAVILARNLGRDDGEWILPLLKAEHDAGRVWTPDENKHDILGP